MTRFKEILPKVLPTGAALLLFFIVSALYFAPQFRGEVLPQHDVQQYEGMAKEIWDNRAQTGEDPQWAGRMFGGMPAYLINVAYPAQLVKNTAGQIVKIINTPAAFVFFAMVSMWLMLLIVGVNPWVGIIPSLMYGLSTYFFLIIGAGHVTKMWALVYAPLMMGGAWLTLRSNMWLGGALTALFASLEIGANHPQITYYFLLAMAALWISEGIVAFRKKHLPSFARRTAVLLGAGILAVGSNFAPLWYTMHHSKQTIRGGSELAAGEETSQEGLALDYATAWSYGRAESWNLLIPDFMGGDSGRAFTRDGEMAKALKPYGLESFAEQLPAYWGEQPYTAGPTYLGAAALFLALLGLLLASGRNKWWIAAVSLLTLLLAWGHNFMGFTEFAFKYLPGYNKFRTVSMALVVVEWTVPLLAALALMPLWRGEVPRRKLLRALAWAGGITGGFCLLFAVAGSAIFDFGRTEAADFMSRQYYQMFQAAGMQEAIAQGAPEELGEVTADAMAADRAAIMRSDAWRSLLMIALAAGSVLLFALGRIRRGWLIALLGVIVLIDLVPVNLRYLPQSRFVAARRQQIQPTEADRAILRDPEPGFRVLNLTVSPFNDLLLPPFGGRLSRRQAGSLPGPDRALSYVDGRERTRHAQHALPHPLRPGGTARRRIADHGQRPGLVRAGGRRCRHSRRGDRRPGAHRHQNGGRHQHPRVRDPPPDRRRRGNPPGGVPPQLSPVRIHGHCARHGDLLGDLLQGRLDSLYRRHRNPIFPSRLPVAGNGAPGRYAHGRMAVPRSRMEHRRRRDARRVAHDSRRHHCNRYTRFTP